MCQSYGIGNRNHGTGTMLHERGKRCQGIAAGARTGSAQKALALDEAIDVVGADQDDDGKIIVSGKVLNKQY